VALGSQLDQHSPEQEVALPAVLEELQQPEAVLLEQPPLTQPEPPQMVLQE